MVTHNIIDDQKLIPLRWVFISLGFFAGCLGSIVVGAIAIGTWTTRISLGQETQNSRISSIESDRSIRITQGETFQRDTLSRLSSMEAKINILLERNK